MVRAKTAKTIRTSKKIPAMARQWAVKENSKDKERYKEWVESKPMSEWKANPWGQYNPYTGTQTYASARKFTRRCTQTHKDKGTPTQTLAITHSSEMVLNYLFSNLADICTCKTMRQGRGTAEISLNKRRKSRRSQTANRPSPSKSPVDENAEIGKQKWENLRQNKKMCIAATPFKGALFRSTLELILWNSI